MAHTHDSNMLIYLLPANFSEKHENIPCLASNGAPQTLEYINLNKNCRHTFCPNITLQDINGEISLHVPYNTIFAFECVCVCVGVLDARTYECSCIRRL